MNRSFGYPIFICSFLGALFAFVYPTIDHGFWATLHSAYSRYLTTVGIFAGYAIPVYVFLGFLLSISLKSLGKIPERGWPNKLFLVLLFSLPVFHWLAGINFFLQASRYSPKIPFMLSGIFQITMLATIIIVALSIANRHKWGKPLLTTYVLVSMLGIVISWLMLGKPIAGGAQFIPILSLFVSAFNFLSINVNVLYALLACATVVYGALLFFMRKHISAEVPVAYSKIFLEANLLFTSAICLFSYFITSQFDKNPTTPFTHIILMILVVINIYLASIHDIRPKRFQKIFGVVVLLWIVEAGILFIFHADGENDPVVLIKITGAITTLAIVTSFILMKREHA
jgi:hypothetical protein